MSRMLVIFAAAALMIAPSSPARELERELERLYGHKPTTQEIQIAEKALAAQADADRRCDEQWAKVQPELARGVSKGVLHKNTAARKFSRLSRRIAALA